MNENLQSPESKTVVITGATGGLGKALSLRFAGAGCRVIGLYRADSESAEALKTEFHDNDLQGVFIRQDITDEGEWTEFDRFAAGIGTESVTLIANACPPFVPKPLHLTDWQEFSDQINVGVKGAFLTFRRLLPAMVRARTGTVISVLSSAIAMPPKGFSAYLTAKMALDGLMRAAAAEYAERGIRFFSVSPGFMKTSLTENWNEHLKNLIYAKDEAVNQPSEIAEAIFNLAKDTNVAGKGEIYRLDGARHKESPAKLQ